MILEITGLTKNFGGLTAVSGIDINVNEGRCWVLSVRTEQVKYLLQLITGVIHPTKGKWYLKERISPVKDTRDRGME